MNPPLFFNIFTGMKGLTYITAAVADILLPRTCAVCGRRMDPDERFLCRDCIEDMPLTYTWDREYHPIADRLNCNIQKDITGYEPYIRVASLFFYDEGNGYRHICHRLKYKGDTGIGRRFGRELGSRLAVSPLFTGVDTIVPVPLHWKRLWSRGYNQAAIIGREVAASLGARFFPKMLVRRKNTISQTTLDDAEKHGNVRDAFRVSAEWQPRCGRKSRYGRLLPSIRHILITDDVFTSGATTAACCKALREVFPSDVRISVATLAAVDKEQDSATGFL